MRFLPFIIPAVLFFPALLLSDTPDLPVDFNREILPLLARQCFPCHGPDESARQADLRLDLRDEAIASGALDPDDWSASPVLERIQSVDPDLRMPPPEFKRQLQPAERKLFTAWILSGAPYDRHWAFQPPQKPTVPDASNAWSHRPIDRFLHAAMRHALLEPNPRADRYTLARRLYQDLLGLIPTPDEVDAFVQDPSPNAYEQLVDRLLASPRYGEHWARSWLDLARYSDTNGYEKDRPRSIWAYRDWVVEAINQDMPFDQFTVEQIAGDMLPAATVSQRIATGFHRNTMLNEEGGIDPLEYRFYAMVDRVATTGTVWMGLTVGCAQCHSHKFDPISQTDFYRLMALLNNADEPDLIIPVPPSTDDPPDQQRLTVLKSDLIRDVLHGEHRVGFRTWIDHLRKQAATWSIAKPASFESNLPKLERLDDNSLFASGDFTKRDEYDLTLQLGDKRSITAIRLEALPDQRLPAAGPGRTYYEGRKGQFFLSELNLSADSVPIEVEQVFYSNQAPDSAAQQILFDGNGSSGWSNNGRSGERHVVVLQLKRPLTTTTLDVRMLFERHFVAALGRFRFSVTTGEHHLGSVGPDALSVSSAVETILTRDESSWTDEELRQVALEYIRVSPTMAEARKPVEQLQKKLDRQVETLVMQERPSDNPRKTFRHHRGEWLSKREEVTGNVPSVFPQLPDERANRLGLANWLVSQDNPLFARVLVNRTWRHFMGAGLVRSDGDFGIQSSRPSHPALLDWLACEFVDRGMSRKQLHRLIVMSATYRQRSDASAEKQAKDPTNRFFARGPRHRVSGETIRDMVLFASGQLSLTMGGPSVKPPQPHSVTQVAYGNPSWSPSPGEDRYRRSLYTFSKRTAPFAAFATFDGPSGEICVARRDRSNTPLQALTLLNDEMFVELARHLASAVYEEGQTDEALIQGVFRRLLTRPPREDELNLLRPYYARQLQRLRSGELSAQTITNQQHAPRELAALTMVARVVMNLDEMITKR